MTRWMWIAIVLAAGCERKQEDPGPPCDKVADHVEEVARKAYPGHGDMLPGGHRKAYIAQCESRKLTAKQRRCMLNAPSTEAIAACLPRESPDEKKPQAPRRTPAPGAPTAPAPAAPTPAP